MRRWQSWLVTTVAALVMALARPAPARAASPSRPGVWSGEAERRSIAAESAEAAALLDRAESAARGRRTAEVVALLNRAQALLPSSRPLARRHCELLATLGLRDQAVRLCDYAISGAATAHDWRTMVAALLSGPGPTTTNLLRARNYAEAAVRQEPAEPWGYAARFDLARSWGDPDMIDQSLKDLRAVAPDHEEMRRALAAVAPTTALGHFVRIFAWLVLVGLCLGTLGHAGRASLLRRRQRRTVAAPSAALVVAALFVLLAPTLAEAQSPSPPAFENLSAKFPIDDANPAASVPPPERQNANPLEFGDFLQDLIRRAEAATARNDHPTAVRYYLALAKAVPSRATAFGKLCESLQAAGRREDAIKTCRVATGLEGTVAADFTRLAELILAQPSKPTGEARTEVDGIIKHLQNDEGTKVFAYHVQCDLALRLDDVAQLEQCTSGLAEVAPADPKAIAFQWSLALKQGKYDEASRLVEAAQQAGMAPEGIARMQQATRSAHVGWPRRWLDRRMLPAVPLLLAGAFFVLWRRRRALPEKVAL